MEVAEYFNGARRTFTVPLDLSGTAFYRRVWAEVAAVPYGETRSYQEIAETLGAPRAVRAVGAANGANPVAPLVCCQRIVGSDGSLTGYGPGCRSNSDCWPWKMPYQIHRQITPTG
jgi:O-6-methylguanine DNA methyltransferase